MCFVLFGIYLTKACPAGMSDTCVFCFWDFGGLFLSAHLRLPSWGRNPWRLRRGLAAPVGVFPTGGLFLKSLNISRDVYPPKYKIPPQNTKYIFIFLKVIVSEKQSMCQENHR